MSGIDSHSQEICTRAHKGAAILMHSQSMTLSIPQKKIQQDACRLVGKTSMTSKPNAVVQLDPVSKARRLVMVDIFRQEVPYEIEIKLIVLEHLGAQLCLLGFPF